MSLIIGIDIGNLWLKINRFNNMRIGMSRMILGKS
jgi:hypothetical protein